jgi:hypothetical protein
MFIPTGAGSEPFRQQSAQTGCVSLSLCKPQKTHSLPENVCESGGAASSRLDGNQRKLLRLTLVASRRKRLTPWLPRVVASDFLV